MTSTLEDEGLNVLTRDGQAALRVADGLRDLILGGDIAPGTRLRQEEIAAQFGSSRVPVREALKLLETEGLVTLVANAGAWVSQLSLEECEEIYRTRERVEPLLLRLAAPTLTPETLDRLQSIAEAMAEGVSVEEFLALDRQFHLGMYESAHTRVLGELVPRLWNMTQPYRRAYSIMAGASSQRVVHDEHNLILWALREGDVDTAERVLTGHIRRTRRHLAMHPEIFTNGAD